MQLNKVLINYKLPPRPVKKNRIKLGLGYDEAKFNYLNNSQFSCF